VTETATDNLMLAARDVRVEAGEKRRPRINILAYTGGIMRVPGWGDIVIDLAGLDVSGGVAILSDHDSTRRGVVGHGRAEIAGSKLLTVVGTISATGQAAREIVDAAANGFPWQASVGVEVHERRRVAAGQRVEVNGKVIEAPAGGFTLVTKGRLREVSVVGIGCDDGTAVSIAASRSKEKSMDAQVQDAEVQETDGLNAEAGEATRVANIASICGAKHPEIQARAIEEGWDETRCELEVLRASRPKAPAVLSYGPVVATGAVLEAALLSRMGQVSLRGRLGSERP